MKPPPRSVFGYGSLMNGATHDYGGLRPARLDGWRRLWRQVETRPSPYLTVEPDPGGWVEGAVADVPEIAWAALDAREAAYERREVGAALTPPEGGVVVYAVPGRAPRPPLDPVRLSYLDVVVQGALRLRGPTGARRFFETTGDWGPVIDDRRAPRYARAQTLTPAERRAVDEGLDRIGVRPHPA